MLTINIRAECNALVGVKDRTPTMEGTELDPCFGTTFPYRDSLITTVKFSGRSAWERHPADEFLYVIEGAGFITEIDERGYPNPQSLSPGVIAVVTSGRWHQVDSNVGITLLTISPQPTDHLRGTP